MQPTKTLLLYFTIGDGPMYLSQQETLTMWSRALLRSGIEPQYSEGFNPHPRLSLPLPRSVGVQGDEELLTVRTGSPLAEDCAAVQDRLNAQLPQGCRVFRVEAEEGRAKRYPASILYVISPDVSVWTDAFYFRLELCLRSIQQSQRVEMIRQRPDERCGRAVDIGGYLQTITWKDHQVQIRCQFSGQGTVRIDELLAWIGLERRQLAGPILRTGIEWLTSGWDQAHKNDAAESAEGNETETCQD